MDVDSYTSFSSESAGEAWREVEDSGTIALISQMYLCSVIHSVHKLGLAKKLYVYGYIGDEDISFPATRELRDLLKYLSVNKILSEKQGKWEVFPERRGLFSDISGAQLGFYLESYGEVVANIAELCGGQKNYGIDINRDGAALGRHCATLFSTFHTPIILQILKEFECGSILDLGCGSGQALMDIVVNDSRVRGVGLDLSPEAIGLANEIKRGREEYRNLEFVVGDAFCPDSWSASAKNADAIIITGVMHEHFRDGDQAVIKLLSTFSPLFSKNLKVLIVGEPELRYDRNLNDQDLFLVHILTKQGYPRERSDWLDVFLYSGLKLIKTYSRDSVGPRFNFFVLGANNA